ncbi:hypothetical protein SORDD17_01659 [Streptococcus oralis]|uniref:Uncharacterized protein n=1 Tax=Streptococcus oralis TaxID=1303 RepID=A0A139RFV3_STROR|nr:hypothetical protein SORDD17_01659 [Streptococcus oralis]
MKNRKPILQIKAQKTSKNLTLGPVQDFHALLVDRLQHDRGQFKQVQNAIIGSEFYSATPSETLYLVAQAHISPFKRLFPLLVYLTTSPPKNENKGVLVAPSVVYLQNLFYLLAC